MIIRHHILCGDRALFRPGWDCHGLPIEMAVIKKNTALFSSDLPCKNFKIREACGTVASVAVKQQMQDFKSWGVIGAWNDSYQTSDIEYELAELQLFKQLVKKGLVVRNLQPVYWSPTSETAIAESELEYNPNHKNLSAFVAFKIQNSDLKSNYELYLTVWTTTIWSLPANEAVAFSPHLQYNWYYDESSLTKRYYLVATNAFERILTTSGRPLIPVPQGLAPNVDLSNIRYHHPFDFSKLCPVIPSAHVTASLGSGLVHVAPVHGHEDWSLGEKFSLPTNCPIDDRGCFTEVAGLKNLTGKKAMSESDGIATIIDYLNSDGNVHLVAVEPIVHKYPYDWRTKSPIMIKASKQWFIDLRSIRNTALKTLEAVDIQPDSLRSEFVRMLSSRDYWCISRQRAWGVPIPILYTLSDDKPVTDDRIIQEILNKFTSERSTSCWWQYPVENFISPEMASAANLNCVELTKGRDILDVWFDSGSSWFSVKPTDVDNPEIADCYVEGVDQFRGWFLSSLLLSAAISERAPYKKLLWHGFVVDDSGRKMSKSLGNVVQPIECMAGSTSRQLPAIGLDGMRLWVARSQSESLVRLGPASLGEQKTLLLRLRNTLSFLLGNLSAPFVRVDDSELQPLDKFILHRLTRLAVEVRSAYDEYNFRRAINMIDRFFTAELSQFYLTLVKDRLYCDHQESARRRSCLTTLQYLLDVLVPLIAPIVPFTSEEVASFMDPTEANGTVLSQRYHSLKKLEKWNCPHLEATVNVLLAIREQWLQTAAPADSTNFEIKLLVNNASFLDNLEELSNISSQADIECNAFATEIFHSSNCEISRGKIIPAVNDENSLTGTTGFCHSLNNEEAVPVPFLLQWTAIDAHSKCNRCRRFVGSNQTKAKDVQNDLIILCQRCSSVTKP